MAKKHHARHTAKHHTRHAAHPARHHTARHVTHHTSHHIKRAVHHARHATHHASRHVKHAVHHARHVIHHASRHARHHASHHARHAKHFISKNFDDLPEPRFDLRYSLGEFFYSLTKSVRGVEHEAEHSVVIASAMMLVLGLVYFVINLWIVQFGAGLLGLSTQSNWVVFSAAMLTVACLLGSSVLKKIF